MSIIIYNKSWNRAMMVLAFYIVIGFIIAIVLPESTIIKGWIPFGTHISTSISLVSKEPERTRFFWSWMIVFYPIILAAFSFFAPIKLTSKASKAGSIGGLIVCFIFFGLIATPSVLYSVFVLTTPGLRSRLERLAYEMAESRWGLFYGGELIS